MATVHGQMIDHMQLARLWARWNGQRGTEAQALGIMRTLSVEDLRRMLTERGVVLPAPDVAATWQAIERGDLHTVAGLTMKRGK